MTIIRTTTPSQTLEFPEGTFNDAVQVWVMYKQRAYTFTKKWYGSDDDRTDSGIEIEGDVITVKFTQEETKGFRSALPGHVMVKWLNGDGDIMSSDDCPFDVAEILDDSTMEGDMAEILDDTTEGEPNENDS